MRGLLILGVCASLLWLPAEAQVTVDLHALQALPAQPGAAPRPAPPPRRPAAPPAASAQQGPSQPGPSQPSSAASAARPSGEPAPPAPALPESVPQTASIPPIAPAAPAEPPPLPPVSANAPTAAAPNPGAPSGAELRVTFGAGQSDLSPDSVAAIKSFASGAGSDQASFTVQAYAPGAPDDPSTARRLSLARAMAVRNALVSDGIASARIFVRALGAQYGGGPPDRVDIDMSGPNDTAAAK